MPAVEGNLRCLAGLQKADPGLCACSKACVCHAALQPRPVQRIKGLLKVQEEEDLRLLRALIRGDDPQVGQDVVSSSAPWQEASLCAVYDLV